MSDQVKRLCFPVGHLPFSGGRVAACCHCGYFTTPRVSRERADEALASEHGWTGADQGCGICRAHPDPDRPWDVFKPLADDDREVWVCKDFDACSQRHEAIVAADRFTCGCSHTVVQLTGHYHPWAVPDLQS